MPLVSKAVRELAYDKLWLRLQGNEFRFEEAVEGIFGKKLLDAKHVKYASKIINELTESGYAIHRRADYDQRVRIYKLLHPEKVSNAWAIINSFRGMPTFIELLERANAQAEWDYLFVKDSAISRWSNAYYSVEVQQLSVSKKDLDGWVSLFKLARYQVLLGDSVVAESPLKQAPKLSVLPDLEDRLHAREDHYQLAEHAVVEAIREHNILGSSAVLVVRRQALEWQALLELASKTAVINRLGFMLESLNAQSGKKLFSEKIINSVFKMHSPQVEVMESRGEPYSDARYEELETNWRVRCNQAGVFRKIVEDLVS